MPDNSTHLALNKPQIGRPAGGTASAKPSYPLIGVLILVVPILCGMVFIGIRDWRKFAAIGWRDWALGSFLAFLILACVCAWFRLAQYFLNGGKR